MALVRSSDRAICSECNRGQGTLSVLLEHSQLPNERIAVFTGHPEVANQHVGSCREYAFHRFRYGACDGNGRSSNFQHPFYEFARIDLVIDDQYANIGKGYIRKWRVLVRRCLRGVIFFSESDPNAC